MDITIHISEDQASRLEAAFRRSRCSSAEEVAERVAQLALQAWVDWLSGSRRYASLTDQYTDWVEQLFLHLLPEDELPSTDRLYNSFNIPYGQARYIQRVLENKTLARWRQRATANLKITMGKKLPTVDEMLASDPSLKVALTLDRLAFLELKSTWERLFQNDPECVIPPDVKASGNVYVVTIVASCFRTIYDAVGV